MIEWVGHNATIVENLKNIEDGDRIILPGIGNFGKAMNYLHENKDILDTMRKLINNNIK